MQAVNDRGISCDQGLRSVDTQFVVGVAAYGSAGEMIDKVYTLLCWRSA